ncbi:MAG: hypothetical protein ABF991_13220, partial [Liquorilactobacillus hordei]|uniref:hypothetical protein n=1 Tax=Liquorilactobacillus hordei TaxID=468911 RepID=UPI0039ED7127
IPSFHLHLNLLPYTWAKKEQTLLSLLKKLALNEQEQILVNEAISQIEDNSNENIVLSTLKRGFSQLAVQQKLSKTGLTFLTEIQKPDFNTDVALASMTWI